MTRDLEDLIRQLEHAAARLRRGDMEAGDAAGLVERCAELAGRLGAELDRSARDAAAAEGQEQLL